jgi:hypothetical protein
MTARPDKLDLPNDKIDYSEIPPTSAADWQSAEVLLPSQQRSFV